MKELKRMPKKQPPKAKPKIKGTSSQKERFIEYAKEVEADESGEKFERALGKIMPEKVPKNRWLK